MNRLLKFSDPDDQDSNSMRTSRRRAARNFLNTVGATYHMLNAVARMDTNDDEFSAVGFHGYRAKDIPFLQVRNVQFQSAILHMWEALQASSEQKFKTLFCLYETLLQYPESRRAPQLSTPLGTRLRRRLMW